MPAKKAKFIGPIIDVRYVSLKDGRKVQQITRGGGEWETPETIDVGSLGEDERDEIVQALRPSNNER